VYNPALKLSSSGVPILSKAQLEEMAERYVQEYATVFDPEDFRMIPSVFAEQNLKLKIQY